MARQAIAVPNYILNSLIGQRLAAAVPSIARATQAASASIKPQIKCGITSRANNSIDASASARPIMPKLTCSDAHSKPPTPR
jgi:hypothetical protein